MCPSTVNNLGGGLRKECCDCCLLAKDLLLKNQPCIAPTGFSAACLKAFSRCCQGSLEFTETIPRSTGLIGFSWVYDNNNAIYLGDRCAHSNCDHLCHDRGGETVECSCRSGYDLGPDGTTCVDRNECRSSTPPCEWGREVCVNTVGSYLCQPLRPDPLEGNRVRFVRMRNESRRGASRRSQAYATAAKDSFIPIKSTGITCPPGWIGKGEQCVDVDECLLLVDDCLESQRCLNLPGSFKCIRTLSCGTGYAMDSDTEDCIDVDECNLGAHDCGPLYQCRNTQGSYRCDPKKCAEGELQNPQTGECTSIDCPLGYYPSNGMCSDIDECATGDRCAPGEECVNTAGSFRCQQKGNICSAGYVVNENTGFCDDINECLNKTICGGLMCINLPGSYKCRCNAGYEFNEKTKSCVDVDECEKFAGHVCDLSAECENTIGSFTCKCKPGFKLASDGRRCEDINECLTGAARCEQKCINIPGSYQCICDRGYTVGNDLCMGGCINTKGSYLCECPPGYKIQTDGRTCVDVDECALGECQGHDRICVNTLGQYKCHNIECPPNYVHDKNYKNRCNRQRSVCSGISESVCKARYPVHITWQYIAIPKGIVINSHRPTITLFTIKGPAHNDSIVQFELNLKRAIPEEPSVLLAIRQNFLLQKGKDRNSAVIAVRDTLDGPQTIEMELTLRLTKKSQFTGKYLANLIVHDGYSCLKVCNLEDAVCLANHTKEILYQFRALPSMSVVRNPIEVSRIRTHMETPFSVSYYLDAVGQRHFIIEQDRNIGTSIELGLVSGIVKLARPLVGPAMERIRVNIHTKSRTGVILAYNVAIIEVHVSRHFF
ncbi:unnamed protein product [Heligmosomoides polygyrus]|uniref:Fibulin-1 n=1 Tax=Heligmosomoides polygyrus TaxID=6339 RepID=A0A183FQ29_HELPZ|nr:unnamed protein product [Heligmosomoides polygyrus]